MSCQRVHLSEIMNIRYFTNIALTGCVKNWHDREEPAATTFPIFLERKNVPVLSKAAPKPTRAFRHIF